MSTIKVDTLQTRAGSTAAVTGAGFVATDQIRGNTAANSVTVVAEGGTVTTNLQQGLAKVWVQFDGSASGAAARDSFNLSSLTDNGTGDYTASFTNARGNANHAPQGVGQNSASTGLGLMYNPFSVTTTNTQMKYVNNDAAARDSAQNHVLTNGDLA